MKIKDIVYEEAPVPGQAPQPNPSGQPQMGKVSKVQPGVGGAPGMVSITKPDGSILTVPSNQITTGTDGKMSVNTQPEQNGATQPAPTANGQPNITMGQDLQMAEEPANSKNTITVKRGPNGLIASDGDPVMATSTGREVDQAYMADPANAINRVGYINFNGTMIPALNTGHKWKIGPKALQMISGIQGQPYKPAPGAIETNPGEKLDIQYKESINESAEVSRIKFLSGL